MDTTRDAGVGTTIHDLRHTAASLMIADVTPRGSDTKAVQVILEHSTATMTMDLYGHLSSEATGRRWSGCPRCRLMTRPR